MKRINIISLFLLLLNYQQQIEASTTKDTPQPAAKNFQKFVSTCSGTRDVYDDHGGSAGFTSNCRIEVWSGDDVSNLSEFKDLSSEQQEKIKAELSGQGQQPVQPQTNNNLDHIKLLAEEATNRHYMCMEAKRSILDQLKAQLPAGLNSCDKITQVLNDLKLSPLLETFINKVNGPMKEIVARIHVLEKDTQMPEAEKREAIRKEKSQLTMLLDEDCKDDHPSIRFHNVGYIPSPDLAKVKMTLLVTHPDRKTEFFNLPVDSVGSHADILRAIADAAALHGSRGNFGSYEARYLPGGQGADMIGAPAVISFVPSSAAKLTKDENIIVTQQPRPSTSSFPLIQPLIDDNTPQFSGEKKTSPFIVENNTSQPTTENTNSSSVVTATPKEEAINSFIKTITGNTDQSQIIDVINNAFKTLFDKSVLDKIPNVSFIDPSFYLKSAERKEVKRTKEKRKTLLAEVITRLKKDKYANVKEVQAIGDNLIVEANDAAKKELKSSNSANNNSPPTVASPKDLAVNTCASTITDSITNPIQQKDAVKTAFELLFAPSVLTEVTNFSFVDPYFYLKSAEGKEIKRIKEKKKKLLGEVVVVLKSKKYSNVADIQQIGDELINEVNKQEKEALNSKTASGKVDTSNTASPVVAVPVSPKDQAVNDFLDAVVNNTQPSDFTSVTETAFSTLFDDKVLKDMPNVSFFDPSFYSKSAERKDIKRTKEKKKALLGEIIARLKKASFKNFPDVQTIGDRLINEANEKAKAELKNKEDEAKKSNTVGSSWTWGTKK